MGAISARSRCLTRAGQAVPHPGDSPPCQRLELAKCRPPPTNARPRRTPSGLELPHVTIVLRTIAESAGNERELIADVILAVSDLVRYHPRWVNTGIVWLEVFDQIKLAQIREKAKATGVQPLRDAIVTLVYLKLEEMLGPSVLPKPPKPAKVKREPRSLTPKIEQKIALGMQLLELRSKATQNKKFGSLRRKHFDVDTQQAVHLMRVARAYGGRPEIYRRLSWKALRDLSSPTMQIRRARGQLKPGRPKRADQPALRTAAKAQQLGQLAMLGKLASELCFRGKWLGTPRRPAPKSKIQFNGFGELRT